MPTPHLSRLRSSVHDMSYNCHTCGTYITYSWYVEAIRSKWTFEASMAVN